MFFRNKLLYSSSLLRETRGGLIRTIYSLPCRYTLVPAFCILLILTACQQRNPVEQEKSKTLTADERYLVDLYMKITEIEENLQDNPEAAAKKRDELKQEIDVERVRKILLELEKNPRRWLVVYNRINELLKRRAARSPN